MLRVLSGPQTGAQIGLRAGWQLVGSDEQSCDIVLFGEGMAGSHCRIESMEPRAVRVLVEPDAAVQFNGRDLPAGDHDMELPAHLRLAGVDLLLYVEDEPASQELPGDEAPSAATWGHGVRGRTTRWVACAACVLGVGAFMSGAMGWFEKVEPRELAGARQVVAGLGYRDLSVAYDVEGLLTVTGYVRTAQDAEHLRNAFRDYPGKAVAVRVAVIGAATQLERSVSRKPAEAQKLGAGSVLIEPQSAATLPMQASTGNALDLQVKALRAGEDGYIETVQGARYFVGSQLPGGYVLKAVADNAITLTRDDVDVDVPIKH